MIAAVAAEFYATTTEKGLLNLLTRSLNRKRTLREILDLYRATWKFEITLFNGSANARGRHLQPERGFHEPFQPSRANRQLFIIHPGTLQMPA